MSKIAFAGFALAATLVVAPANTQHSNAATLTQHSTGKVVAAAHKVVPTCENTDGTVADGERPVLPCYSEEGFTVNTTHTACTYSAAWENRQQAGSGDSYWNGSKGTVYTHTYPNGKVVRTCQL